MSRLNDFIQAFAEKMQSNVPVTCLNEDKNGKMSVEINEIELCRSHVHVLNGRVDQRLWLLYFKTFMKKSNCGVFVLFSFSIVTNLSVFGLANKRF